MWKHDDCVCVYVCVGLRCVVVGGMWSGVNASCGCEGGWEYGYVCVLRTVELDVCEVWCLVCGVVCVSLSGNRLGAEGGAAMAGAVQHLTSLTALEYV